MGALPADNQLSYRDFRFLSPWDPFDSSVTPTKIVVTCFLQTGNKILIVKRGRKDAQYGLWGIPGGKLEGNETPEAGLIRELQEELGGVPFSDHFQLLDTAMSQTPTDGQYGLYLYHSKVPESFDVSINPDEHLDYRWVDLDTFQSMDLLTA